MPGETLLPLSVALTNVTLAGRLSVTVVPVALLWPVLVKRNVYCTALAEPPVTDALSTLFCSVRFAGGVTQKLAPLGLAVPSKLNVNVVLLFEYALKIQRMRWPFCRVPESGKVKVKSWLVPLPVWVKDCVP